MRCEVVRLRLLSALDPARTPADVRAHLAGCEFCRDWHEDLCTFEQHVPYLPVPTSRGKAKLLKRLLDENSQIKKNGHSATPATEQTLPESSAATAPDSPTLIHPRFFTFPGLMAGLAAVVLFVLGTLRLRN
jgi:hypothetical protein